MIQPDPSSANHVPRVVIIGGGFSGAVLAWHLHRTAPHRHDIIIVEPRDEIGRGLAYDSSDPAHRINVPAQKMNLDFDEEGHFEQWLIASGYPARDPAAVIADVHLFPTRAAFGDYVNAHVRELGEAVVHKKTKASAVVPHQSGYRVVCEDDENIDADAVVLAVCHTPPQLPGSIAALRNHPRLIANPWQPDALRGIEPGDRVLIVGTGLTMADIIASLDRGGHRGPITAISRRGLRSQTHAAQFTDPFGDFASDPARTALSLLRHIRQAISEAASEGLSWHPVLDQLRLQGSDIWRALPLRERARLIHHLRPFWDTYRFRIAPQVNDVILRRITDGTLVVRAASVRADAAGLSAGGDIPVELRTRRSRAWEPASFDAIVIATGPAHGTVFESNSLLGQIGRDGLARPDPLGLGIDVDLQGRAIDRDGHAAEALYVAGPLARGTFGELMGAPDLARHARNIAETLARAEIRAARLPPHPVQA
ncbi:MAG TPA: FAD/NAD(P)-binding protein [Afipia sp.]